MALTTFMLSLTYSSDYSGQPRFSVPFSTANIEKPKSKLPRFAVRLRGIYNIEAEFSRKKMKSAQGTSA